MYYVLGYDKTYDESKAKNVANKRKVKLKKGTSAEEEIAPPEEAPTEHDIPARKEERSADKASKKLKKEAKKKRKHKKSPENLPPNEEVSGKITVTEPVDLGEKFDGHESRVENSRVSPEAARKARKADVVMKSVVVERPRSPTPEEHLARKRAHSPVEYPREDESHARDARSSRYTESGRDDNSQRHDEAKPKKQRQSADAPPPPPPPPPYDQNGSNDLTFQSSAAPRNAFVPSTSANDEPSSQSRYMFQQHPTESNASISSGGNEKPTKPSSGHPSPSDSPATAQTGSSMVPNSDDTLMELLRRHPVMWQGLLGLKNDSAAIQMHYVSGNSKLADYSLPKASGATGPNGMTLPPVLKIAQRMRMELSQLDGVTKRMQVN